MAQGRGGRGEERELRPGAGSSSPFCRPPDVNSVFRAWARHREKVRDKIELKHVRLTQGPSEVRAPCLSPPAHVGRPGLPLLSLGASPSANRSACWSQGPFQRLLGRDWRRRRSGRDCSPDAASEPFSTPCSGHCSPTGPRAQSTCHLQASICCCSALWSSSHIHTLTLEKPRL